MKLAPYFNETQKFRLRRLAAGVGEDPQTPRLASFPCLLLHACCHVQYYVMYACMCNMLCVLFVL